MSSRHLEAEASWLWAVRGTFVENVLFGQLSSSNCINDTLCATKTFLQWGKNSKPDTKEH